MSTLAGIILVVIVIVMAGCAVAFGSNSRADISIEQKLEIDPSVDVETEIPTKERRR